MLACNDLIYRHELRVREIAPVGEEVGIVECTSNINDTNIFGTQTPMSVKSRGKSFT